MRKSQLLTTHTVIQKHLIFQNGEIEVLKALLAKYPRQSFKQVVMRLIRQDVGSFSA